MALESGDHIWYYDGQGNEFAIPGEQTSTDKNVPRQVWFPGAAPGDQNDYRGNGKHIYYFVLFDTEVRRGQPQLLSGRGSFAWLHNNPGNLSSDGRDYGQFPGKLGWHNFFVFPDHDTGFAAIQPWLENNGYLGLSITQTFKKYAPSGDGHNTPEQYAAQVAAAVGISPGTLLQDLGDDEWASLLSGIERVEGTIAGDAFAYNDPGLPQVISDLALEL